MAHGIFKKFDGVGHFVGMAMGLSLAGVFLGNFISLAILAGCEAVGLNVGEGAALVTVPIGCAIIAVAFIVHQRNTVIARLKIHVCSPQKTFLIGKQIIAMLLRIK